ncbi:MAG: type II secretion system protein [Ruminococcus sp.]|nr:type II secretion system protein [Ruminococcus sp.]
MKTENKKTLRGTVLFTVVAVMALLIIFLTSTLALASATGNRAHKSYASAQASYTARAAIDSFAQSMTRNEEIAAIVQNLGNNPTADAIHPKVEIGDLSLGQIGYYNASGTWVPDRIEIAPLENSTSYAFYDTDGDGTNEWGKVEGVRVTVTCRVGKEEETVSAYIRKSAVSASSGGGGSGDVKGLQEAGGNTFCNGAEVYGGLGVGLADTVLTEYHYHNNMQIKTSLNFFNCNLIGGTSSLEIHVAKPVKAAGDVSPINMPYSETVITGSFMTANDKLVTLDYTSSDADVYDIKDVPYLYINELLTGPNGTRSEFKTANFGNGINSSNVGPFNVYAGTVHMPDAAVNVQGDIYMMDSYDTSAPKYSIQSVDRDGNHVPSEDVSNITRGDNVIGHFGGGQHALYTWAGSVVNRNEQGGGHSSTGGSIYCNGNLTLVNVTINGDVRVMGDFTYDGDLKINGDLVVRGTIHEGSKTPIINGTVYNGTGGGGGVKLGYTYHDNELLPGYTEVINIKFENNEVPNVVEDTDSEGKTIYKILDGEGDADVYPSKPYYRINVDGTEDISEITTDQFTIYESKKDGEDVVPVLDGDGKGIRTKDDATYYDDFGTKLDNKEEAFGSYYTDSEGNYAPDSDAIAPIAPGQKPSYAAYVAQKHQEAYPQSMTREKIYGEVKEVNGEMKFVPADEKTKIITTLKEAREALNMDPVDGTFNSSVYLNAVPGGDPVAWDGSATITSSCTIKNTTIDKNITVDTASEIWIVLDNCSFADDKEIVVQEDPTGKHGTVNFLIRGTVTFGNGTKIRTNTVTDGCTISYTKDFGIIYYAGGPNPILDLGSKDRNMICGSVKAPTMNIIARESGPWTIKYIGEYSSTPQNVNPKILGNALVNKVERLGTQDLSNFKVVYTKSGTGGSVSGGGGGGLVPTSLGYFDIGYLAGA